MTARTHSTQQTRDRAYLVAGELPGALLPAAESLGELRELARTAGATVVGETTQRLKRPNAATFIGKGKVEEVVDELQRLDATTVIFDDELSPSQQRNLEEACKVKVLDRTALILDIFAQRANTREGRLQVELAQAEYLLPRLRGQWQHLERLEGAIGTRGPGETQIETDRRLIRSRISRLKRDLDRVRMQRGQHRRRRQRSGAKVIAIVGYTNAGKSTLMQALTNADGIAANKLFATLDPLTRKLHLPGQGDVLLTDTVGFIQKLPTDLVAAFRATLEELEEADVLLHVVDISHPNASEQAQTVDETLATLGVAEKPHIIALNKIDRVQHPNGSPVESEAEALEILDAGGRPPLSVVRVSATRGWGLDELRALIDGVLDSVERGTYTTVEPEPTSPVQAGPGWPQTA